MQKEIKVSIDRISYTGEISSMNRPIEAILKPADNGKGFFINGTRGEGAVYVSQVMYGKSRWKIEYNPNHISARDLRGLEMLKRKLKNIRLTRIDIAFDIYNADRSVLDYLFMNNNRLTREIYSSSGKKQTIYHGSKKSSYLIRSYEKTEEQHKKGITAPEGWFRIEFQLRNEMIPIYEDVILTSLNGMRLPKISSIKEPFTRSTVNSLLTGVISFSELSKTSRAKYRKIIRDTENADYLPSEMQKCFNQSKSSINEELLTVSNNSNNSINSRYLTNKEGKKLPIPDK